MSNNEILLDIRNWNRWLKERFPNKDIISLEELISDYEDLISDVERLEEELHDLEQDMEDNYKPISKYEQYGISEHDFY